MRSDGHTLYLGAANICIPPISTFPSNAPFTVTAPLYVPLAAPFYAPLSSVAPVAIPSLPLPALGNSIPPVSPLVISNSDGSLIIDCSMDPNGWFYDHDSNSCIVNYFLDSFHLFSSY